MHACSPRKWCPASPSIREMHIRTTSPLGKLQLKKIKRLAGDVKKLEPCASLVGM